jgi:hypothetical protein
MADALPLLWSMVPGGQNPPSACAALAQSNHKPAIKSLCKRCADMVMSHPHGAIALAVSLPCWYLWSQ